MSEDESYQCPRCEKYFGSYETFEDHAKIEHDAKVADMDKEESSLIDFKSITGKIGGVFNKSFMLGILFGIMLTTVTIAGGYTYLNNIDHRTSVGVTVVTCENCSYEEFRTATDRMFNANYHEVDYQTDEGQELIEKYDLNHVPGFIFDRKVEESGEFFKVEPILIEFEDAFVIPDTDIETAQRLSEGQILD